MRRIEGAMWSPCRGLLLLAAIGFGCVTRLPIEGARCPCPAGYECQDGTVCVVKAGGPSTGGQAGGGGGTGGAAGSDAGGNTDAAADADHPAGDAAAETSPCDGGACV